MTREELKKLGLSDELIDQVIQLHGIATEDLKTANAEITKLKGDLKSAQDQITTLEETVKKSENVDELKTQMESLKTDYEKQIKDLEYNHSVETYLSKVPFSNDLVKKAVTTEFKEKGFKLDNGKLLGADDYIAELKKNQPTAFVEEGSGDDGSEDPEVIKGLKTSGVGGEGKSQPAPQFMSVF